MAGHTYRKAKQVARQVTIRILCDVCLNDDVETEADELPPFNLVGNKSRVLTLCPEHRAPYDALIELIKEYGQIVDIDGNPPVREVTTGASAVKRPKRGKAQSSTAGTSDEAGEYVCDYGDCGGTFTTPQGLGAHRFRAHGIRSGESVAM